jgi:long-chain acyl-CoA synthetase
MANTFILKELTRVGQAARLKGFELVKAVHLDSVQFSVDNNLLTPTFKLKRAPLQQHYQKQIDNMYMQLKRNGAVPSGAIM